MSNVEPDFTIRVAKDVGAEDRWADVGVAYKNARGSITCYFAAYPLNDKVLLYLRNSGEEEPRATGNSLAPRYLARVVKDVGGKDKWFDIGVTYVNARGSVTIYLHAVPVDVSYAGFSLLSISSFNDSITLLRNQPLATSRIYK